jgi:hypothetical protein
LNLLYAQKIKNKFIICEDKNINYIHRHNRRKPLDNLLAMYNLKDRVSFPIRNFKGSSTVTDNIFIDLSQNFTINPLINGLSDHDIQLLKLENISTPIQEFASCYVRDINSFTVDEFQSKLRTKIWENIFEESDTNDVIFNNFLNIYLNISYACFTKSTLNP